MIYFPNSKEGYEHFKRWILNIDENTKTIYVVSCEERSWPIGEIIEETHSPPRDFSNYDLVLIINSATNNKKELKKKVGRFKSVTIIRWDAYWLDIGLSEIVKAYHNDSSYNPLNLDPMKFNKLFTLFNNVLRPHRIQLLDSLYKYGLADNGYISVNQLSKEEASLFSYWKNPKIQKLDGQRYDDNNTDINITRMFFPSEWYQTPIHIVTETLPNKVFITEKLAQPILGGKPFMVLATKGYHQKLKDLGFKMYDNIFNYDFDNDDILDNRIEGIIHNLLNIKDKSLIELYEKCKENIKWNYYNCIRLVKDQRAKIEPNILEEIIKNKNMILDYGTL